VENGSVSASTSLQTGCVWTCCRNFNLGSGDMTDKHLFTLVDPAQFEKARIVIAAGGYDQVLQ